MKIWLAASVEHYPEYPLSEIAVRVALDSKLEMPPQIQITSYPETLCRYFT